jgi:hypothetical protein
MDHALGRASAIRDNVHWIQREVSKLHTARRDEYTLTTKG